MREIRCCHACDIVVKAHNNFVLNRSHWFNACLCARDISVWNIVYSHLYFWNNILPFFLAKWLYHRFHDHFASLPFSIKSWKSFYILNWPMYIIYIIMPWIKIQSLASNCISTTTRSQYDIGSESKSGFGKNLTDIISYSFVKMVVIVCYHNSWSMNHGSLLIITKIIVVPKIISHVSFVTSLLSVFAMKLATFSLND